MKPIPIVGYDAVCPAGASTPQLEKSLIEGRSGISTTSSVLPAAECPLGEIRDGVPDLPPVVAAHDSRCNRLLAMSANRIKDVLELATKRFGPERIGAVVGTSASGNTDLEAAFEADGALDFDYHHRQSFGSAAAMIRRLTGIRGPAFTVSTACSSGANAMISAAGLIQSGVCDAVVVGSSDALCRTTYEGFRSLQVMDDQPCRPFDATRAGLNLGEGAAVLVLSKERLGGPIDDQGLFLAGFGASSDAHHMTAPDPEGLGAARSMANALETAGIAPADVGYLNLHGTGTRLNDESESRAVERVFGAHHLPCSSTKGYTGHLLGAAAGVEAVITLIALKSGRLWRNLNLEEQDPKVAIRILKQDEDARDIRYAMSNSFAFGGNDTSIIFGRWR
ncbi:MAG: beta-ketoacyl-ACP synthase [Deltaproteobacteria bacterium]|nr:beta-ketoacyl-ACP synthase [Deltaproteobacteria bacterium]